MKPRSCLSSARRRRLQPKYARCSRPISDEPSNLFADGKALQAPPEGNAARDDPASHGRAAEPPAPHPRPAATRGGALRHLLHPCHGLTGDGHGRIPSRGLPQPPSFHEVRSAVRPAAISSMSLPVAKVRDVQLFRPA